MDDSVSKTKTDPHPQYQLSNFFPLASCEQYDKQGDLKIYYCIFEKIILAISIFTIGLIFYQLFIVYMFLRSNHQIKCKDFRFVILSICFYASVFTFFQIGIFPYEVRPITFFIVSLNQFIIMMSLIIYYIDKASAILPKRK